MVSIVTGLGQAWHKVGQLVVPDRQPVVSNCGNGTNGKKVVYCGDSHVCIHMPAITHEYSSNNGPLVKENWVVENLRDPSRFKHFLVHIFARGEKGRDPKKPVVLLIPGILCNGNLFRMARKGGNYKDLNDTFSYANVLAREGYHVVIVNPRYAKWIYLRYVEAKLGLKNNFPDDVSFEQLMADLPFYLDVAAELTRRKVVVDGFSLGGMELLFSLALNGCNPHGEGLHPSLAGAMFLGTPVSFNKNQYIVKLLRYYNPVAKVFPSGGLHPLSLIANHVNLAKPVLRQFDPATLRTMLKKTGLAEEIFNFDNMNLETLPEFFSYVLERATPSIVNYFTFLSKSQFFTSHNGAFEPLPHLYKWKDLPVLAITGSEDKLAPPANLVALQQSFGANCQTQLIKRIGHDDLVIGEDDQAIEASLEFLGQFE